MTVITLGGERRIWEYNNTLRTEGVASPIIRGIAHDITERKRAESALRASELRYRRLFENNVAGVAITSIQGQMIECNEAWARIFGYSSVSECRQHAVTEYYIDPGDRAGMLDELKRKGKFLSREIQLRRKDGKPSWVLTNSTFLATGEDSPLIQATVVDITERKLAERALQASETHFRLLVEQASDGIFIADAQGNYIDVNSAGAEMLGYTREEILQRSIADIVVPADSSRLPSEVNRFAGGATVLSEWNFRRKDGSVFPGEVCGKRLPDGRLQGIVRDISERRQAEELMRRNEERFRGAL
jgi:PAS domain S-box-containing protein